jgi:hypothetical protein
MRVGTSSATLLLANKASASTSDGTAESAGCKKEAELLSYEEVLDRVSKLSDC